MNILQKFCVQLLEDFNKILLLLLFLLLLLLLLLLLFRAEQLAAACLTHLFLRDRTLLDGAWPTYY